MLKEDPQIAILVSCFNQREFLDDCLRSLRAQRYPRYRTYLLDSGSTDGSTAYATHNFPECVVVAFGENLGFAVANNRGLQRAFEDGADLCLLLNSDTCSEPSLLAELVASYQAQARAQVPVGLVQATVLLFGQRERVNTAGNALHYLGYGFCKDHLKPHVPGGGDRAILSASGAAMLVARDYFERVGGFDDEFFVYNEDQNLSWRGLLLGYRHFTSAGAVVYHKYTFREHAFKMYHSEKNRVTMLLQNYSVRTLCVLAPMLALNELLLIGHAALNHWLGAKLRSYWYVAKRLGPILRRRREIQRTRVVADKALFPMMDAELSFDAYAGFAVRQVISPLMKHYHRLAAKAV